MPCELFEEFMHPEPVAMFDFNCWVDEICTMHAALIDKFITTSSSNYIARCM